MPVRVNQLLLEREQILASTDVRQHAQVATATAKLQVIDNKLAALKGDGRVERARAYLKEQVKQVKLARSEAL